MKNKNLLMLSLLATLLLSSMLISMAAAQEEQTDPSKAPDPSTISDQNQGLIAPGPDENATDGEQRYYILDSPDNQTATNDTAIPYSEDGNLIYANTVAGTPDNTLAFVAIAVLSIVIVAGAIGAVYYRKNAAKRQA